MSSQKRALDGLIKHNNSKVQCIRNVCATPIGTQLPTQAFGGNNKTNFSKMTVTAVEVMETPDKAESDKKNYRVIRLANGLTALLISDPIAAEGTNGNQPKEPHPVADEQCESDSESAASASSGEEDEDDEEERPSRDGKEKLAACSLCVGVGSFSDPRDIQGLAHFLGKWRIRMRF